jgi:cell division protein YceG involved in septum cleavage
MDIQTPLKPLTTESHPSKMFRFVILGVIGGIILLSSVAGIFIYRSLFDAPSGDTALYQFTVGLNEDKEQAAKHLKDEGFIKSERGFLFALGRKTNGKIKPGGFRFPKDCEKRKLQIFFKRNLDGPVKKRKNGLARIQQPNTNTPKEYIFRIPI